MRWRAVFVAALIWGDAGNAFKYNGIWDPHTRQLWPHFASASSTNLHNAQGGINNYGGVGGDGGKYDSVTSQLHFLHKDGDVNGVVAAFSAALRGKQGAGMQPLQSYDMARASYNIGFQALLKRNRRDTVMELLAAITSSGLRLEHDTLHILLSDAFRRKDVVGAEALFSRHFLSPGPGSLAPSIRTFNIMIEGFRAAGDVRRAREVLGMMDAHGVMPDPYTFSSVIRMSSSGSEIVALLSQVAAGMKLSAPLTRAAVETLGKLGCPSDAVHVALLQLTGNNSVHASARSGDTLLTALLAEPSVAQRIARSALPGELSSFFLGHDRPGDADVGADRAAFIFAGMVEGSAADKQVKCGSRGYFLLFSRLYELAEAPGVERAEKRGFDSELTGMRDRLWLRLRAALIVEAQSPRRVVGSAPMADADCEEPIKLNGRLSFSILRCFTGDIVAAKNFWKVELLSFAKASDCLQEIFEMSLEGLMYNSGYCGRPDIGLEIAVTVRKRNWPRARMEILSRLYFKGRETYRATIASRNPYENLLNRGLEKSLCAGSEESYILSFNISQNTLLF